ncbi:MAG TPA: hypothetical protein HA261_13535 [Methanosarcina sp.]|nr:hypothetical protein [Methanosarcina sp.]
MDAGCCDYIETLPDNNFLILSNAQAHENFLTLVLAPILVPYVSIAVDIFGFVGKIWFSRYDF